jgi:DNA-binding SARP family transcriptional activator
MIALRLLGPVDVRGHDGRVLGAVLAQPKRLALLAYLTAATPSGFHSRDTLLALLWPDSDQEHGRAALRQAVYVLRRALGEDTLIAYGDAVLGVDLEKLWCDVVAFDDAADAGDPERALELYRGELLEGFHVSGAQDFERWVDRSRARLSARATDLIWKLAEAEEHRGDVARAGHWARRLLATCPDDERVLRRAALLLYRAGDRVGAVRACQDFARRLATEYDIEPAAETRALISVLRAGGPPAARGQPAVDQST